ncbi:MAG TPA: hypothetical protein VNE62_04215 [Actinomycetota bacterium]|nr:hypothetical protein [Actinomycetota bacterium]
MRQVAILLTDLPGVHEGPGVTQHGAIIRRKADLHRGEVVRIGGEMQASFCVFDTEQDAVDCVVAIRMAEKAGPAGIRMRAAVHAGPVRSRGGDHFGPPVNRASRIRGVAHPGQTVLSDPVARAVDGRLPPGWRLDDLGHHVLRDLDVPLRLWQLDETDAPSRFPPLMSLDSRCHNLPEQWTSFVGRDEEVVQLAQLWTKAPVVTITGPAGVGKTRLALQAGAVAVAGAEDGVWLVDAAGATPSELGRRICAALGAAGSTPADAIAVLLEKGRLLLILDGCDEPHVARAVQDIAGAGVRGHILATARRPLAIHGERVFELAPLAVPGGTPERVEDVLQWPSVQLFSDRAALVDPTFEVTVDNVSAVVGICAATGGIPAEIEKAARRVRVQTPKEILDRLAPPSQ